MSRLDVGVYELSESWSADKPVVILDAATAARLVQLGELTTVVAEAILRLEMSDKLAVLVEAERVAT